MSSIFSNFKRKSRSRAKAEAISSSKAKPLDILPGLTEIEEEDPRPSTSSTASTFSLPSTNYLTPTYRSSSSITGHQTFGTGSRNSAVQDAAERKRDSRRVVLTGAEGLTFEDFFPLSAAPPRPAPSPPRLTTPLPSSRRPISEDPFAVIESPLNSINVRFSGLHLQFDVPTTPSTIRSSSPTPSLTSIRTTSTTASSSSRASAVSGTTVLTPPTSDDESQAKPHPYSNLDRAPTCKSQRASIHYMPKPMPDMQRRRRRRESTVFTAPIVTMQEIDNSDSEDASWFAQELSDIVSLSPAPEFELKESRRARPDSVLPPPRTIANKTNNDKLPASTSKHPFEMAYAYGPSTQLDPTFPQKKRRTPSRLTSLPPIVIESPPSPTMEEKTEELLAMLASAAMDLNFSGTGLTGSLSELPPSLPVTPSSAFAVVSPLPLRPPPRSAIPADVDFSDSRLPEERAPLLDDQEDALQFVLSDLPSSELPPTPKYVDMYSHISVSLDSLPVEIETPKARNGFGYETPVSPSMPDSPFAGTYATNAPPRVLRSRWSSSTLSSLVDVRQAPLSPSSWKLHFSLGSSLSHKKASKVKSWTNRTSTKLHKTPITPTHERHSSSSSQSSNSSSDSGDSTVSSGLRRKPIPVEIFMRT